MPPLRTHSPASPARGAAVSAHIVLALVALGAAVPSAVRGALTDDPNVDATARLGLGGRVREGRWAPVFCRLSNRGENLSGVIEVESDATGGIVVRSPLVLPQYSTKAFHIYVPLVQDWGKLRVRIRRRSGKVIFRETFTLEDHSFPRTKTSGEPEPVTAVLGHRISFLGRREKVLRILTGRDLPDHWAGFDVADRLVIAHPRTAASVPPESVGAILDWVRRGGTLVAPAAVSGPLGAALRAATGASAFAPAAGTVPLRAFDTALGEKAAKKVPDLLRASPVPVQDVPDVVGTDLLAAGGRTLARATPLGAGRVVWTAFAPQEPALQLYPSRRALWDVLFAAEEKESAEPDGMNDYETTDLGTVLDSFFSGTMRKHVSAGWLVLFMFVYLGVIGPVDFFIVRRMKRPALTWITFPTIVLLFAFAGYWYSMAIQSRDLALRELTIVDAVSGQAGERIRGYAGLVSPRNDYYTVQPTVPNAMTGATHDPVGPQGLGPKRSSLGGAPRLDRVPGEPPRFTVGVPVNTVWTYYVDGVRGSDDPAGDRLPMLVVRPPDARSDDWEIVNNTGVPLRDAILVTKDGYRLCYWSGESRSIVVPSRTAMENMWKPLTELWEQVNTNDIQNSLKFARYGYGGGGWQQGHDRNTLRGFLLLASFGKAMRDTQEDRGQNRYGYGMALIDEGLDLSHVLDRGEAVLIARLDLPPEDAVLLELLGKRVDKRTSEVWVRCRIPAAARGAQ